MPRHVSSRSALATFAALFAAGCADNTATSPMQSQDAPSLGAAPAPSAPGRYLVGFAQPTATISSAVLAASGGAVVDAIPGANVLVVDGVTNPTALKQANPAYIEAEFETTIDAIPADGAPSEGIAAVPEGTNAPWYASGVQWDMKAMKADEAWAITNGASGINICIVDTGVDNLHQELNGGKVLLRTNFVTATTEQRVDDPNGHGTHVASEAAARGTVVAGVAPRANILSARVLNTAGSGSETAITNGIRWCADNGAHVINVSIGGIRYRGNASFTSSPVTYGNALTYAYNLGALVIISAGNSNLQLPNPGGAQLTVPAQAPGAFNVGATGPLSKVGSFVIGGNTTTLPLAQPNWNPFDPNQVWQSPDGRAFYSNYGTGVTVFAPGGRGGVPLSSAYRYINRVAQGSANDAIWAACSGQSSNNGATNTGGVPTGSATCNGQTNRYWAINGTSMAAPHVSGMAAVLYAEIIAAGGTRSNASRLRVQSCITSTTDNVGPAATFGGGRVNVKKAVDAIRANAC